MDCPRLPRSVKRCFDRRAEAEAAKRQKLHDLHEALADVNVSDSSSNGSECGASERGEPTDDLAGNDDMCNGDVEPFDNAGNVENDEGAVNFQENADCDGNLENSDVDTDDSANEDINLNVGDGNSSSSEAEVSEGGSDLHDNGLLDDGTIPFRDDQEREYYVIRSLREWACEPGVLSHSKLDDLLHRLSAAYPLMPLTHRTLLEVKHNLEIEDLPGGGRLWYNGIKENLERLDLTEYLQEQKKIIIDVNMDGLPLYRSTSKNKFWPILGRLVGTSNEPFIIAIYCGVKDPQDVNAYLAKFVAELKDLKANGFECNDEIHEFVVRHYILDAPARSMIKCIIGHGGYYACEKCTVKGVWVDNRTVYLDLDQPLRTDDSFRNREQPRHHLGVSSLEDEELDTGMVSQFRLDTLHLVYSGVFKRLLNYWLNVLGRWKLHVDIVHMISEVLIFLSPSCPFDFNRRPRSLDSFKTYKCTEFRRILHYDGILVFKDLVHDNIYKHFLLLHCAMYILSSKKLLESKPGVPEEFIRAFISHAAVIYGEQFVVYNVHSLCHLPAECEEHGTAEEFSAFCFENKLKSIKECLRSGFKPLEQVARREKERSCSTVTLLSQPKKCALSRKRRDPVPNEIICGTQYHAVTVGNTKLQDDKRNSCFMTKRGDVVVLRNIVLRNRKIHLVGQRFLHLEDYYNYPMPSSDLGINRVSVLGEKRAYRLSDIDSKCWLMPDGDFFLSVPLLHTHPFL